jgi:hypothetical protein
VLDCDKIAKSEELYPSSVSASSAYEEESEYDAEIAFDVVPLIVAFIVPRTVKSPRTWAEPDTPSEPVTSASNIFM